MSNSTKIPKHFLVRGGLTLLLLFVLVGQAAADTYIWREAEDYDVFIDPGMSLTDWCATNTGGPGGGWSKNKHLVFGNGETSYDIDFPETGTYYLWLRYAQSDPAPNLRPTDIYLDGRLELDNGTNSATGGWCGFNAIWELQTTIDISSVGIHTLRLDADTFLGCCWTHIDTILLTTDGAFTPPDIWSSGPAFSNADDPPSSCVAPPSGLVSWWPFDESSGTTTADIVDSNPGVVKVGAVYVAGKVGNALDFNGAGGRVEIANNANLSPDNQITLEAWVKPDVLSGLREIYRRDIDGNRILFSFQSGGFCSDPGSLVPVASPCLAFGINTAASPTGLGYKEFEVGGTIISNLVDGSFHHVAATYDGASRKIYIDGDLKGSVADTGPIGKTGATLAYIGSVGASEFFDGIIDELGIYDRALSASEIQAIYNAGTAGKCKAISGAIKLINGLGLDPSTDATLVQKLQEAQDKFALGDLTDARSKVCNFVDELEAAVAASSLTTDDANLLLKEAATILGEIKFP